MIPHTESNGIMLLKSFCRATHTRRLQIGRQVKFSERCSKPYVVLRLLVSFLLFFAILCTVLYAFKTLTSKKTLLFDDVSDMLKIAEEDEASVRWYRNRTANGFDNSVLQSNPKETRESRLAWDYIYGEIVRKPVRSVLTKYQTRLLRDLFARTNYTVMDKYAPAMDVSCNNVNDINDQGSLYSFSCSETSHKCPDGSFSQQSVFAPREGSSVTWENVVIVLMVSAGREPYLEAASETWISRLHPDATLFFARDAIEPDFPGSISGRQNTIIFDYPGPFGLDSLDVKAFLSLSKAFDMFAAKGKRYFLKIDIDSLLLGHNLIRFLNKLEHWFSSREQALYFGHPFCGHGDNPALGYARWCYAGGGAYGLSVEALQILIAQIRGGCEYFYDYVAKAPNFRPADNKYGGRYEDVMVGRCLRQARTRTQMRGTSLLACGSFFPYAPLHYYTEFGNSKEAMCTKLEGDIIAIHNLEPSAIRYLDQMVFEYPLGGTVASFSPNNIKVQELIDVCGMRSKKMWCDLSKVPLF